MIRAKRARFGFTDPLVVNRTVQWGISGAMVVTNIAIGYSAHLVYGPAAPPWTQVLASCALLVGAGCIWLGFFPPAAYRTRLERAFGTA